MISQSCPVNSLPAEVLGEIFIRCLPEEEFIRGASNQAPMVLGEVCRAWRKTSVSLPQLWSSISVVIEDQGASQQRDKLILIKTWLERTAGYPLSIQVENEATARTSDDLDITESVLRLLLAHIHHWHHVQFVLHEATYAYLTSVLPKNAPLLQSLDLALSLRSSADSRDQLLRSFPTLTRLAWRTQGRPDISVVPWARLTHLRLRSTSISLNYLLETIPLCQELSHLWIYCWGSPSDDGPLSVSPIILSKIRLFHIFTNRLLGPLFDVISLPSVQDIDIRSNRGSQLTMWPRSQFSSMFPDHPYSLQKLFLDNMVLDEDDLITCLRQVGEVLVHLVIFDRIHTCVTDKVLALMTYKTGFRGSLCPKLEVIKFISCISSTDGMFARMVESRWRAGDHVTRPVVVDVQFAQHSWQDLHGIDYTELKLMRDEGLKKNFG